MKKIYSLDDLPNLNLDIKNPCLIYLKGDLGAGKTTISKHILNNLLQVKDNITSPTYTYYNKYIGKNNIIIYHFDLYRLKNYDEFFSIGGESILDDNNGIILVEWPELIEKYYKPNIEIKINKTEIENERELIISFQ